MKTIHYFMYDEIAEAIKLGQPFTITVNYSGNDVEEIITIMKNMVNRPAQVPFVIVHIVVNGYTTTFTDVIERNSEWFRSSFRGAMLESNDGCAWRCSGSSCCLLVKKWLLEKGINLGEHTEISFCGW